MAVFSRLFDSTIGLLSIFTIGFIIAMAIFMFFWIRKQADSDAAKSK